MRKVVTSVALASVIFSVCAYAENDKRSEKEIKEEIQRLKMENELLELKNENERLQKGGSKKTKSEANANVDKSGFLGFCKNQFANTGCYIGAEIGMAKVNVYRGLLNRSDMQKPTSIPLYLTFGYNHYFKENQSWRAIAFVGYSSHNAESSEQISRTQDTNSSTTTKFNKFESQSIHIGIEGSYGYDFLVGKHTLGASAGFGLSAMSFFGQKVGIQTDIVDSTQQQGTFIFKKKYSLDGYTAFQITLTAGLHYAFKNNHIINARFRIVDTKTEAKEASVGENNVKVKYGTGYLSEYLIGYAYKF